MSYALGMQRVICDFCREPIGDHKMRGGSFHCPDGERPGELLLLDADDVLYMAERQFTSARRRKRKSDLPSARGRHQSNRTRYRTHAALTARIAEGMTPLEAAKDLGLSRGYAFSVISDPLGEKDRIRKASYGLNCRECGRRTNGSDGRAKAAKLCNHCSPRVLYGKWNEASLITLLRALDAHLGHPPCAQKFHRGEYDGLVPECDRGIHGVLSVSQRLFGTWNKAILAAGLEPRRAGVQTEDGRRRIIDGVNQMWQRRHEAA